MKISPRRASDGFPMQRLQLICAVIEKRLKLSLWNRDVYLNVVGGLRVSEPASDLAVAVTITSSLVGMKIKAGICFIGEIGLSGEIRRIKGLEIRIAEAVKMGFTTIIIPDLGPKNPFKKKKFSNISRNEMKVISTDSSDLNAEYDNINNTNDSDNSSGYDDDKINQIDINLETKIKINKTNNKQNKFSEHEHEVISCSTLVQALTIALEVESFNDILDKLKNSSKKKRKISDSTDSNNNNQEKTNWSSSRGFDSNSVETENNFYSENNDDDTESINFTMNEDDDDDDMNGNY